MSNGQDDYLSFLKSNQTPSEELGEKVKEQVQNSIRNEWLGFLSKLAVIHLISGMITFLFCPQFGLNPFKASPHLPHVFMSYGVWACGLFCGSVFMGSGAIVRWVFLNSRERIMANQKGLWATLILSSSFYGVLMLIGSQVGELVLNYSIVFFISWLLGALLFERVTNLVMNRFSLKLSL